MKSSWSLIVVDARELQRLLSLDALSLLDQFTRITMLDVAEAEARQEPRLIEWFSKALPSIQYTPIMTVYRQLQDVGDPLVGLSDAASAWFLANVQRLAPEQGNVFLLTPMEARSVGRRLYAGDAGALIGIAQEIGLQGGSLGTDTGQ